MKTAAFVYRVDISRHLQSMFNYDVPSTDYAEWSIAEAEPPKKEDDILVRLSLELTRCYQKLQNVQLDNANLTEGGAPHSNTPQ